jgi:hypothetical protein
LLGAVGLIVAAILLLALIYNNILTARAPQMTPGNAVHIIEAARAYTHDLRAAHQPIPLTIDLTNLVALKYLQAADAAPFNGLQATLSLVATNPAASSVLMRVRNPDGSATLLLTDGTSRETPAGQPAQ